MNNKNNTFRILAKDSLISNNTRITGLNNNDLIIGPSGSGKTRYYIKPNIMQCNESMIIADVKGALYKDTAELLRKNGYDVMHISFTNPSESTHGYNPFDYIRRNADESLVEQDIVKIANSIIPVTSKNEPYWEISAAQYLSCLIAFVMEALPEEEHTMEYVYKLIQIMNTKEFQVMMFDFEMHNPDSIAVRRYKLFRQNQKAEKMHSSIIGILGTNIEQICLSESVTIYSLENRVDFKELGKHKTALFLSVSDTDTSFYPMINLLYAQAFQQLFDYADTHCKHGSLDVPVRIFLDDFASNVYIPKFDNLISVTRSRNIAVSIIIQSISQLENMYTQSGAKTIMNNCDNCLYLGGQDLDTAKFIGGKMNLQAHTIMSMPIGAGVLITRGTVPKKVEQFDITQHERYCQLENEF